MTKRQKKLWETRYKKLHVEGWDELLNRLKALGGEMFIPMPQSPGAVQHLLKEGRSFDAVKLRHRKDKTGDCHANTCRIWTNCEDLQLVTGYALINKLWLQHIWLWNPTKSKLVDVKKPAKKYFGVVLSEQQAHKLALANIPEFRDAGTIPQSLLEQIIKVLEKQRQLENLADQSVMKTGMPLGRGLTMLLRANQRPN